MRKPSFNSPLATLLVILFVCVTSVFIINACRKIDRLSSEVSVNGLEEKFFNLHKSPIPLVRAVTAFVKGQNSKYHFVEKMVKQIGFPYWDKAMTVSNSGHWGRGSGINEDSVNITYIPFVRDTQNYVNASLLIKTSPSDTVFQILCDWQYANYGFDTTSSGWYAKDIFHIFSKFDKAVFGRNKFLITDRRIFGSDSANPIKIEMLGDSANRAGRANILSPITICTPYRQCCNCGCLAFRNSSTSREDVCCYPEYGLVCTTFWVEDGWNPVNGGGGSGSGTSGCNGSGWIPPTNCGGGIAKTYLMDSCGPGWTPLPGENLNYNPNQYDTIGITNQIRDNFPCLYGLLHDTLLNANFIAQLAGSNIFHDSAYFNLTFEISTTNTLQGQAAAHTWVPSNVAWFDASGHYHFSAKIRLNPFYMEHATKEGKISIIIHEAMHAIIALRWYQYQNGLGGIDSFYLKQHFPIHWNYFTNQGVHPNELQDHEIMGEEYSSLFSQIGRPFFNPTAPAALRDTVLKAMGYSGLDSTTVWSLMPSMGIDTCKYRKIMLAGQLSLIGSSYSWGACPLFTTNYADSLGMTAPCK